MSESQPPLLIDIDARGVAHLTLNRPNIHNVFDEALIDALAEACAMLGKRDDVRVVVLSGKGKSFCAGADINWMTRAAQRSEAENYQDALHFAGMMRALDTLAKPTIAAAKGHVMGGGVGLCCACDIVVAASDTKFAISEVKLGILPSVIGPYVVNALGRRQARRLMMTAERFDAAMAHALGLAQIVVAPEALETEVDRQIDLLLKNGPKAVVEAKGIAVAMPMGPVTDATVELTARTIARVRAGAEAREGFQAFLEKRNANWVR